MSLTNGPKSNILNLQLYKTEKVANPHILEAGKENVWHFCPVADLSILSIS